MESAGALGRGGLPGLLDLCLEWVRARSRTFWVVTGLTVLAAVVRFATLGAAAYHHDEIVTASRVLRTDFVHAMEAVGFSESAPPLYYAASWVWAQFFGTDEWGLRGLTALAGIATVPVAYLLGAELRDARAGIAAAALVAVNPMLVFYAQEARAYAFLVLFMALATLHFVRGLDGGRRRDLNLWGVAGALALASHYFAVFPLALQAALLLRRRGRDALAGLRWIVVAGLLLTPLMVHQMLAGRAEWIGGDPLGHRLWEIGVAFTVGEISDLIARPVRPELAIVPLAAIAIAAVLLLVRGERRERRAAGLMVALAGATIVAPVAIGLLAPDKDFVIARNVLPALIPLLVAVAVAVTSRRLGRAGIALGAVLFAYSLGFNVAVATNPALQRPAWDEVAERLGEPTAPRAMITWTLGQASLRYFLSTGSFQVAADDGFDWYVHEVNLISDGPVPPAPLGALGPGFREVANERVGRLWIRRYELPGDDLARLRLRKINRVQLGFRSNSALLDGIGVP